MKTVEVAEGATVGDLFARLAEDEPELAAALRSVLPVVAGEHVTRDQVLADRQEVALLLPVSGG
jgi:molybdopterin converting factor small subunit